MTCGMSGVFAADLGHYVADGHMPLHLTRNYKGQFTDNTGIRSRYECGMIKTYISQIHYAGKPAKEVANADAYIFEYIYTNARFYDSVLRTDDLAKSADENPNSATYREVLWNNSRNFSVQLFDHASPALASLMFTARIDSDKPALFGPSLKCSPAI